MTPTPAPGGPHPWRPPERLTRRRSYAANVGLVPGDGDAAYPTDAAWLESVRSTCVPAFNSYTGRDFDTDPDRDIGYLVPTIDGWGDGDREMSCYATRVDEAPTSESIKAAS